MTPRVEPGRARPARIRRSDLLVPVGLAVVATVELAVDHPSSAVLLAPLACLVPAALTVRRAWPLVAGAALSAAYVASLVVEPSSGDAASWVLMLAFAGFATGLHTTDRLRLLGLASVLGAVTAMSLGMLWLSDTSPGIVFGLISGGAPWGIGAALQRATARAAARAAESERADGEVGLEAERAAIAERARIGSELHDALAHTLGEMVVQASVAADQLERGGSAARQTLAVVAQSGREALSETARLLQLLRHDESGDAPPAVGAGRPAAPEARTAVARADALLPAAILLLACGELVAEAATPLWPTAAAFAIAAAALVARRRFPASTPVAVAGVLIGAQQLGAATDEPAAQILMIGVALFTSGYRVPRARRLAGLTGVLLPVAAQVGILAAGDQAFDVLLPLGFTAVWGAGAALRDALDEAWRHGAAIERARAAQEVEVARAAYGERRRMARELHDVLAHSFSVMIVQASVAEDAVDGDRRAALAATREVEGAGRAGLVEIGGLLSSAADGSLAVSQPQRGVRDLPALAEAFGRTGLAVELDLGQLDDGLPLGVDLATYRIVQEGLTNALRYAPGSRVAVTLTREVGGVGVRVRNGSGTPAVAGLTTGGRGLSGLRERVSLFGGALESRPTREGGFVLAARLPVEHDGW